MRPIETRIVGSVAPATAGPTPRPGRVSSRVVGIERAPASAAVRAISPRSEVAGPSGRRPSGPRRCSRAALGMSARLGAGDLLGKGCEALCLGAGRAIAVVEGELCRDAVGAAAGAASPSVGEKRESSAFSARGIVPLGISRSSPSFWSGAAGAGADRIAAERSGAAGSNKDGRHGRTVGALPRARAANRERKSLMRPASPGRRAGAWGSFRVRLLRSSRIPRPGRALPKAAGPPAPPTPR